MQLRSRALARRRVPDELDRLLYVVPPTIWILVAALTVAIAALLTWGFAGHLPRQLSAQGVLVTGDGPHVVQSTAQGTVTDVLVAPGETVSANTAVALVESGGSSRTITAGASGFISALDIDSGQTVGVGQELSIVQPSYSNPSQLTAVVFLPREDGAIISQGMKTKVSVASAPSAHFGVLRGTVESVSSYPASSSTLDAMLGDADLARVFSKGGPPLIARIRLTPDARNRSGLKWSNPHGPPFPLRAGTSVSAEITEATQSPMDTLFGS